MPIEHGCLENFVDIYECVLIKPIPHSLLYDSFPIPTIIFASQSHALFVKASLRPFSTSHVYMGVVSSIGAWDTLSPQVSC